ncbi:MAG: NAD(P)-dependent oxidoreductase [Thermoleophilia bacterium]|nr:NAD(P)-dependent oxidoreductase [Thermoleophilia bacterium]
MDVGFIGTGLMGAGMVRNLRDAGHDVTVFARTPARAPEMGVPVVTDVTGAVSGRDAAGLCVTDSGDSAEVVRAILATAQPPPLILDMSTIAPAAARSLAAECAAHGVAYLDCPVSGGPPGADAGTLAIMCGGDADAYARAAPLLDAMGDPARRTYCGPSGAGLVAKLVNNALVGVISASTAEALGMAQRAGLDPALAREVVLGATGASWQLENLFPRVLAGDHAPGFTAQNLVKDLGHALGLDDTPMPFAEEALRQMAEVDPALDYGAVARRSMELPENRR